MKVGIVGSGYVGLVTGACFAELGHDVLCVDNNPEKLKLLRKGKIPIYEPGLGKLITKNVSRKRLSFDSSVKAAVRKCEVLFICVNTPPKDNGEADLSYVENVSKEIAENLTEYRLIVSKSTVPVQTGEWIYKTVKSVQPDENLFDVASNPEFLREGSAVEDFLNPDRVVLGVNNPRSEALLKKLYADVKTKIIITDIKSAELIKHASNSFLAAKISFINMVARLCDATGADVDEVALGMGLDPRIGKSFLKAGVGFGGFCFPKDLAAFSRISEKNGVSFSLLDEVLAINETQKKYFVKKIEQKLWNLKNKTIAVWGLAFKANTDDIRFAPSLDIIESLQKEGAHVRAYDPQAMPLVKKSAKNVFLAKDMYDAAKGADAVVLLTEWQEFLETDFKKLKKLLKTPILFDGRNAFLPREVRAAGFDYVGVGRR